MKVISRPGPWPVCSAALFSFGKRRDLSFASRQMQLTKAGGKLLLSFLLFSLGIVSLRAESKWVTYEHCELIANPANDGDSFHVRAQGREFIFRIYYVDAPETDNSFPDRVAAQAKYFHLTVPQTLSVGREAESYTREKLSRPFTVETCHEDARGRSRLPRYFAFVEIGKEDLAEDLVAQGLGRIYGETAYAPDRVSPASEHDRLESLERTAKAQKLGGWGFAAGQAATSPKPEDTFNTFFHSNTPTPAPSASAKLDINNASMDALEDIPGIGPVLAQRIIAGRPFQSADELQRIEGIGEKRYAKLRPYFK
ncbi:MAG TPA: helix-hairpin-helix domain-containing protein [Chthoniobacterales bacterium]|jgi:DNA uptake protein ComE-like DNA-binding protein